MQQKHKWFGFLTSCTLMGALLTSTVSAAEPEPHEQYVSQVRNPIWPYNFDVQTEPAAEQIPVNFYQLISAHAYNQAESLLTTRSKPTYVDLGQMRYFAELKHPVVYDLRDITKQAGVLRRQTDSYAAVKVYLGVVSASSSNPAVESQLQQFKYHRFVVVQERPGDSWRLDDDEAMSASQLSWLQR